MKKMFIEAHKMTREMVEKYGVDYQTQFGLNLSYLLENKEEKEMLRELKGTEKQIKYANDIANGFMYLVEGLRSAIEKYSKDEKMKQQYIDLYENEIIKMFSTYETAGSFIEDWKEILNTKSDFERVYILRNVLKEKGLGITVRIMNKYAEEFNAADEE